MSEEHYKQAQIYIPATMDMPSRSLFHTVRFPIAVKDAPEQICGMAHRVGHTRIAGNKYAIYRLKLHAEFAGRKTATLSGFYILVNGVFEQYDHSG